MRGHPRPASNLSMKTLDIIEQDPVTWDGTTIRFTARGRVDDDGTGPSHGDPCHQSETSLLYDGKPLDADVDPYIVLPPQIIAGVGPKVLGCQAWLTFRGNRYSAVVGDIGPHRRLGEDSIALITRMGIDADPNRGGDDLDEIEYEVLPGQPAQCTIILDGLASIRTYQLQAL
jgi:hypothetical protein